MALTYSKYKTRFPGAIYYYGNASHGFYDIMVWLQQNKPKEKPNIVMPVYIPAKLYRFVLAAGYTPVFYDITPNCGFNPNEVARLIDNQTQAVLAVHYFGIPCPVEELKVLTKKAGVFLIEDCVHTLNSRYNDIDLGTSGDCAMFSIRKMLQLPSGGFLVLNSPSFCRTEFRPSYQIKVRSIFTVCHLIRSRLKYVYFNLTRGYDPFKLAWIPGTGYINIFEEQHVKTREMSVASQKYLTSVDLEKVINRRRSNYEFILNQIKDLEFLKPVYPEEFHIKTGNGKIKLMKGITPYSFPVLTPIYSRPDLRKSLNDNGLGCGAGWPETPFHHYEFTITKMLSEQLLELPVHQGISRSQLKRMAGCLMTYPLNEHQETIFNSELANKNAVK